MVNIGIIGGTGFSNRPLDKMMRQATDYGVVPYTPTYLGNKEAIFVPRHAKLDAPHLVNYRANIQAMKLLNVDIIIALSACGRLAEDVGPGTLGVVSDVDWDDLNGREMTFAEQGLLLHATMNPTFSEPLREILYHSAIKKGEEIYDMFKDVEGISSQIKKDGTYFNINGPAFLTPAKEARIRETTPGAAYIGQTLVPEVHLAREMGIAYAALVMVVDHSNFPGKKAVTHADGVMTAVKYTTQAAQLVLEEFGNQIPDDFYDPVCHDAFRHSLHESQVDLTMLLKNERKNLAHILEQELNSRKIKSV